MSKRRFIRDGLLDEMIDDLHRCREQMVRDETDHKYVQLYLTIHTMYETAKVVLERLEEVLDQYREHQSIEEVTVPIADAAMHLQTGIRTIHNSIIKEDGEILDTSHLMDELENAQRELHLYPETE